MTPPKGGKKVSAADEQRRKNVQLIRDALKRVEQVETKLLAAQAEVPRMTRELQESREQVEGLLKEAENAAAAS